MAIKPTMIRRTLPEVLQILLSAKKKLLVFTIFAILLGMVPTIKSEVESRIFYLLEQGIAFRLGNPVAGDASTQPTTIEHPGWGGLMEFVTAKIPSFGATSQTSWDEALAHAIFGGLGWTAAVGFYLILIGAGCAAEYGSTAIKASFKRQFFVIFRGRALAKTLLTEPGLLPSRTDAPGQASNALQQGASNLSDAYSVGLDTIRYVISMVTVLLLVIQKSLPFAIGCFLLVAVQVGVEFIRARRLRSKREQFDAKRNELVARSEEILRKQEILMAYEQGEKYASKLQELATEFADVKRKLETMDEAFDQLNEATNDAGRVVILVIILGAVFLSVPDSFRDIGDVYFLVSLYTRVFDASGNALGQIADFWRSEATSKSFLNLMNGSQQPPSPAGIYVGEPPGQPGAPPPGVEFRQVAFSYDVNQPRVLDGCSFSVPAGATTLVVGRSGAGKTTLARLILGYWRNYQGQILVDGTDVKEWDGYALRKLMSYVAQQDHIVDETVKDNLAWAFPGPNEEEMLMAVHDVGLFSRHPGQNILQAQAKEFSGGEQQRLSVARMILDKSPIVLLDEPMAGVDAFTFHDLMPRIVDLFRDKSRTVLMVSHRLAFAAHADHIVVLGDGGVVTEQGPFDRLMADKGQFAKLYEAARQELIPDLYPKSS